MSKIPKLEIKSVGKTLFVQRTLQILAIIAFFSLSALSKNTPYFRFDLLITQAIQKVENPVFIKTMFVLTKLGEPIIASVVVIVICGVLFLLNKRFLSLMTLFSTLGASAISVIFKYLVARPRPVPTLIDQFGVFVKPDSFPSGHVLYFIGLYGFLLAFLLSKYKNSVVRTAVLIILALLLVGIGVSRIYVGAHWFSDVLGSYLIGSVWIFFMMFVYKKLVNKTAKK